MGQMNAVDQIEHILENIYLPIERIQLFMSYLLKIHLIGSDFPLILHGDMHRLLTNTDNNRKINCK